MMGLWGSQRQARARAVVDSLTATERVAGDLSLGDQSVLTFCRSLPPLSRCQMRFCPPNRALTAPALPLKAFVRAPFLLSRLFWLGGIQFLPARVGCGVPGPPKNIGAKMTTKPQDSSRTTRRPCYCSPPARGRLSLADGSQKRDAAAYLFAAGARTRLFFCSRGNPAGVFGRSRRRALPPSRTKRMIMDASSGRPS